MPVKELHVEFAKTHPNTKIVGKRDILSHELEGNWTTTFKGRGLEFTGYRKYELTDDASNIDWRASLRSKALLVREFEEYRNFNVAFMLDVSHSMLFTTGKKFKAEYGAEMVYSLVRAALHAGEAVGLFMFHEKVVESLQPDFGPGMRKRVEMSLSKKELYGGKKDFKRSVLQTQAILGPRTILIIVSDFLAMGENWEVYLSMLARKHQLVGIQIKDKRDRRLPPSGQYALQDPNSGEQLYIDTHLYRKKYEEDAKAHERYVAAMFKKLGGRSVVVENGSDLGKALEIFFNSQKVRE